MSQKNVEVVLALFAAWNAGNMDQVREQLDLERVVLWNPKDFPEPGPFIGPDAVMRQWQQQRSTFQADTLEPVTDPVHGADRVVLRFVWHGAGSGPDQQLDVTGIYTVRNGKLLGIEHIWDHAEALEAVGLSQHATDSG